MAAATSLNISESISQGWSTFKKVWSKLLVICVVYGVITMVLSSVQTSLMENMPLLGWIVYIISMIASYIMSAGMIAIMLKLVRGKDTEVADLFAKKESAWPLFLGSLLTGLIVMVGFILLVVPGIYFALRYMFVQYLIVDKNIGPMEALDASSKMTDGIKWQLFGYAVAVIALNLLGALALGLGLLITAPVTGLSMGIVYEKLTARLKE